MLADCLRDVTLEPCFKEHPGPLCKSFAASFTAHFNLLHSTSHRLPQAEAFLGARGMMNFFLLLQPYKQRLEIDRLGKDPVRPLRLATRFGTRL